jgi:hypothetical protein
LLGSPGLFRLIGNDRREFHTIHVLGCGIKLQTHFETQEIGEQHSIHEIVEGGQKRGLLLFVATAKNIGP